MTTTTTQPTMRIGSTLRHVATEIVREANERAGRINALANDPAKHAHFTQWMTDAGFEQVDGSHTIEHVNFCVIDYLDGTPAKLMRDVTGGE